MEISFYLKSYVRNPGHGTLCVEIQCVNPLIVHLLCGSVPSPMVGKVCTRGPMCGISGARHYAWNSQWEVSMGAAHCV
eukprot:7855809-Pyramimonas_sp.AAC.1